MRILSESELIINKDGSIYHLHLKPGELAPNIITVGDPERVAMVSRHFEHVAFKRKNREFITHTGLYKGKPISVISTGIGTDNIDIVMTELDALVNIDFKSRTIIKEKTSLNIVRIGTSGALQKNIELNSIVASAYGLGFDNLLHYYVQKNNRKETALLSSINHHLKSKKKGLNPYLSSASKVLQKKIGSEYKKGITVTCSGFYGPQARYIRLKPTHAHLIDQLSCFIPDKTQLPITNFEMETAGLLGMAKLLGHEALSLNIIVANRVTKTFSHNYAEALDHTILNVLEKF